jgi:hypothetical protein
MITSWHFASTLLELPVFRLPSFDEVDNGTC